MNFKSFNFPKFRMPTPKLPTWQDCHELWSKKRRRQLREQESMSNTAASALKYHTTANAADA